MARFTQYPAASDSDYIDATTFLIANEDGEVKQASLEGLKSNFLCEIKCATVTISNAEMLALNTTPKELVPAQGAGTAIDVISATAKMYNNTTPYATNVAFRIRASGSTQPQYTSSVFINAVVSNPIHKFAVNQPSITSNTNIIENAAIIADVGIGDPTAGDGDVEVSVLYRVINI